MQCLSDADFQQLADGTGPSDRSDALWQHVDGCDVCTERMSHFATHAAAATRALPDACTTAPGSRAATPAWLLSKGDTVGRYVVLEPLGAGGMGEVYAAFDSQLDRKVALKLLRTAQGPTSTDGTGGDDGRARLLREAQAMARLSHPNVVTVHEVGQWRDQTFLSMELVEGGTHLRKWLEDAPRPWREVVRVLLEAGRGLAAAHAAGLVHRDFKPDNVLLGRDGHVRVTDFGLARTDREAQRAPVQATADVPLPEHALGAGSLLSEALTRAGAVLGTPGFMAPEQYGAGPLDARADQFSFCASLYYCLYRQRPFAGTTVAEVAQATLQGRVSPPPREAHVPGWLHRVVLRGLSARPEDRFAAMEPLLAALQTDPSRRTRRAAAVAAVVLALGGVLAVRARAEDRKAEACAAMARPFSEAWGPDAQAEVERAFQATGVPFAADAARGVQRALGSYADALGAMARDACLATRVRGEASERVLALRSACLGQRRGGLEALVRVFARADRQVVEKAAGAAAGLEPLAACADVDWLTSQVQPPPGPQAGQALAGLRDVLAQARAEHAAGHYAQAVEAARQVAEGARAVPFMPLEAEALVQLGASERALGKPADAEPHLQQAVVRGLAAGLREVPVRAAAELVGVAGAQSMERAADVQAWHQLGRMVADRTPVGMERPLAALQSAYGAALVPQDRFDEAEAAQREALAAALKVYPEASWEVASIYSNLGSLLFFKGHAEAALPFNQKAVGLAQEVLGDSHPSLVRLYMDLGNSLLRLQRGEEAATHYQRAHDIATRALPPEHPSLSAVYNNLGRAMITLGRHADAERYLLQDLALSARLSGEDSVDVNITLQSLLRLCILTRQDAKCRPYAERALRIAEGKLPPQHSTRLITLYYVGSLELESGRLSRAVAHLERALAEEPRAQPAPGLFGNLRFALAQAYWKQGRGKGTVLPLLTEARARMLQARRQAAVDELTAWTTEQGLQLPAEPVRTP